MGSGALKPTINEIAEPAEKGRLCAELAALLPDWFGQPAANAAYAAGVADCICLGAYTTSGRCIGIVALRVHFDTTLEIWWMAVDPAHHRQGAGHALIEAALDRAALLGCSDIMLSTLGPDADDAGYADTRAFYSAQGFHPLIGDHMSTGDFPMMWMIRRVGQ